jgi:hypothetical protein
MQEANKGKKKLAVVPDRLKDKKLMWILTGLLFVIILSIIFVGLLPGAVSSRTESYKDVSGSAGLAATIAYDCHSDCHQKYDFNVYLFNKSGQQVSVLRPDKDGKMNAALPGGDYIMMVGKQFGKNNTFPQEPVMLKNGKMLDLRLQYN